MSKLSLFGRKECPVCAGAGAVVCLLSRSSNDFVFACPFCGVAWLKPPDRYVLDEVLSLSDVAPMGFEFPTEQQLLAAKLDWLDVLDPDLAEFFKPMEI
jgi:hypothetical protein